jgi:hypothetical protein
MTANVTTGPPAFDVCPVCGARNLEPCTRTFRSEKSGRPFGDDHASRPGSRRLIRTGRPNR